MKEAQTFFSWDIQTLISFYPHENNIHITLHGTIPSLNRQSEKICKASSHTSISISKITRQVKKKIPVKIGIFFADRGLDNYMHILSIPNISLRPSTLNSLLSH